MLNGAQDHLYDVIVVDGFSSDAIPTHLLTREAIAGYLAKLTPNGVIALHLSNRYMMLEPVVGNLVRDAGLVGRINRDVRGEEITMLGAPAVLAVLARHTEDLATIA